MSLSLCYHIIAVNVIKAVMGLYKQISEASYGIQFPYNPPDEVDILGVLR